MFHTKNHTKNNFKVIKIIIFTGVQTLFKGYCPPGHSTTHIFEGLNKFIFPVHSKQAVEKQPMYVKQ